MKRISRSISSLLVVCIMLLPTVAFAASKSFSFNMSHQLSIGKFASTKSTATITINMTSWGGDRDFNIKVYKRHFGSSEFIGQMDFKKSSSGSPYKESLGGLSKGTKYVYEIWKDQDGRYIKGKGSLSY